MYNYIARNIILPASDIVLGTEVSKQLKFFEKSQWWKPKELEKYQNKKLRALINHAYTNVSYYHNLFKSLNLYPEDIKTKEDLSKLPILTKDIIRKNHTLFLSKKFNGLRTFESSTSGTTGIAFKYYYDGPSKSALRAFGLRGWGFAGYHVGNKIVTISGSALIPKNLTLSKKIIFFTHRNLALTSYNMDTNCLEKYTKKIVRFNPKFIRGYPSSIVLLANYLELNNIKGIKPKAVLTTGESLLPFQRKKIESNLECEVFDGYGCADGGSSAYECTQHRGYHISVERSIYEFIRNNENVSAGESGYITLTDLYNYAMPFIRYDSGDVGIPSNERCPCGRGLPLMESVEGRITDYLMKKDGSLISGMPLTDIFEDIEAKKENKILQYLIIQETKEKIVVKIVKGINYNQNDEDYIVREIRGHIGFEVKIDVNYVDKIPTTKANKRRFIISKISGGALK